MSAGKAKPQAKAKTAARGKPAAAKKSPAVAARRPAKKESALHAKLAKELKALIPSLDEAGLAFLVEQANVHLYNMEVERINDMREEAESMAASRRSGARGKQRAIEAGAANYRIERSPDGANYHIVSGGKWKLFNEAEMLALVRISQGPGSEAEVAERIRRWLESERSDTFADLEIDNDSHDPRLRELVAFLKKKFKVGGR